METLSRGQSLEVGRHGGASIAQIGKVNPYIIGIVGEHLLSTFQEVHLVVVDHVVLRMVHLRGMFPLRGKGGTEGGALQDLLFHFFVGTAPKVLVFLIVVHTGHVYSAVVAKVSLGGLVHKRNEIWAMVIEGEKSVHVLLGGPREMLPMIPPNVFEGRDVQGVI